MTTVGTLLCHIFSSSNNTTSCILEKKRNFQNVSNLSQLIPLKPFLIAYYKSPIDMTLGLPASYHILDFYVKVMCHYW